jgi:hypothetical protein
MSAHLSLRLFAECADAADAANLLSALYSALSEFLPVSEKSPSRYWKMPELFEFSFTLNPKTWDTCQHVVARTATGWTHGGSDDDLWFIWNRHNNNCFLLSQVTWAEIQFLTG